MRDLYYLPILSILWQKIIDIHDRERDREIERERRCVGELLRQRYAQSEAVLCTSTKSRVKVKVHKEEDVKFAFYEYK